MLNFRLVLVLMIFFVTGCQSSGISFVKEEVLSYNQNIKIGKLLETYDFVSEGESYISRIRKILFVVCIYC